MLTTENSGALVAPLSGGKTVKVKIKSGTVVNGSKANPGDIVEVSELEAKALVGYGKGDIYTEAPKPKAKAKAKVEKDAE